MQSQIRVYRIKPGELDAFVQEWREHVVPLRRRFGFEILGAWVCPEDDTFVWLVGHDKDFTEADRAYYASPERAALEPDPARHSLEKRTLFVTEVQHD